MYVTSWQSDPIADFLLFLRINTTIWPPRSGQEKQNRSRHRATHVRPIRFFFFFPPAIHTENRYDPIEHLDCQTKQARIQSCILLFFIPAGEHAQYERSIQSALECTPRTGKQARTGQSKSEEQFVLHYSSWKKTIRIRSVFLFLYAGRRSAELRLLRSIGASTRN